MTEKKKIEDIFYSLEGKWRKPPETPMEVVMCSTVCFASTFPKTIELMGGIKEKIHVDKKSGVEELHIVVKENVCVMIWNVICDWLCCAMFIVMVLHTM